MGGSNSKPIEAQGVATEKSPEDGGLLLCRACNGEIDENYTTSQGHVFHNECLNCVQCNTNLSDATFMIVQEEPVCTDCFKEHVAHRCVACNDPFMGGTVVTAHGKEWHKDCFKCSNCDKDLNGSARFYSEEVPVEDDDDDEEDDSKDDESDDDDDNNDDASSAGGKKKKRKKRRSKKKKKGQKGRRRRGNLGSPTTTEEKKNENATKLILYCTECNFKDLESKGISHPCSWCGEMVSDGVFAIEKHWHDECFVCYNCETPLLQCDDFFELDGKLFCRGRVCVFEKIVPEERERAREQEESPGKRTFTMSGIFSMFTPSKHQKT